MLEQAYLHVLSGMDRDGQNNIAIVLFVKGQPFGSPLGRGIEPRPSTRLSPRASPGPWQPVNVMTAGNPGQLPAVTLKDAFPILAFDGFHTAKTKTRSLPLVSDLIFLSLTDKQPRIASIVFLLISSIVSP
jgi:hypothetical protein